MSAAPETVSIPVADMQSVTQVMRAMLDWFEGEVSISRENPATIEPNGSAPADGDVELVLFQSAELDEFRTAFTDLVAVFEENFGGDAEE